MGHDPWEGGTNAAVPVAYQGGKEQGPCSPSCMKLCAPVRKCVFVRLLCTLCSLPHAVT